MKFFVLFFVFLLSPVIYAEDLAKVVVLKAESKELFDSYYYPVVLQARQESEIYSEIEGIIKETKVKIGQRVKVGQVLMVLRQAKPEFSYAPFLVKSPIEGTVAEILKKVGSPVKLSESLIHVVNYDDLTMTFEIPEAEVQILKTGMGGEVQFKHLEKPLHVSISGISPLLNSTTGTAKAELVWNDKTVHSASLRKYFLPGMIGRAVFKVNFRKGISIPKTALFSEKKGYSVRIVEVDKIYKKSVKIGRDHAESIEILEGIKDGDLVVVNRNKYLKDGEQVKVDTKGE